MMITDSLGLYVHIPFCVSKCRYCDFASFSRVDSDVRRRYIDRLAEEIKSYKTTPAIEIDTIFFGGGTPSLLAPIEFETIMTAIRETFKISRSVEFTVEANPKTLTKDLLDAFVRGGVNRISMGGQTIHENELKILGRIHSFSDLSDSVSMIMDAGISNINIDVMYGIPEQTKQSFAKTLDAIIKLNPTHISAYGLILEEGTPFWNMRESLPLPTEDEECEMYELACRVLGEAGYSHYEISNYARPGYECRHNLKYWRDKKFIGAGLAAYSYFGDKRYGNSSSFDEYLSDNFIQYRREDLVDRDSYETEFIMMHLRLSDGLSLAEYEHSFAHSFLDGREDIIEKYRSLGYLDIRDGRVFLTEKGFYISNSIISELI